jgi:glyoxylase-like metal-dependent hydrolase (beta-lactamase superfamily II)
VLVPDVGVLLAGDLVVVGTQPWAGHGDPANWAVILERLLDLEWEHVVPGHGPVSGRDVIEPLRDYLLALDEAVREGGELPERFHSWGQTEMWERNVEALSAGRRP